ncbi:hypothetical protein D910_12587 [Dendroctonus ponderosae]|uniref:DUF4371 domain-containing protein n=1 Tax=Dendroctonus ponderosae TaxID=77166 RepID=U4UY61_DENPD|nr:hypothetical protein D910_12587 [Dendroctonus ponderosae]
MISDAVDGNPRLTGVALAEIVENLCLKFNIDLSWCVGIGTDSCSVIASDKKGAVQELSKKAVNAKRCPCSNHALNNTLATSSKVVSCRNTSATMRKVVTFANASAKRHQLFEKELGVSIVLQTSSIDLKRATDAITDTMSVLRTKREKVDPVFRQLFEEAKQVAEQTLCPRIVSRQTHRANNQLAQSAEKYFRRAVYIPLLDSVINDLEDRLSPDVLNLFQLGVFIPKVDCANEDEDLELFNNYKRISPVEGKMEAHWEYAAVNL